MSQSLRFADWPAKLLRAVWQVLGYALAVFLFIVLALWLVTTVVRK